MCNNQKRIKYSVSSTSYVGYTDYTNSSTTGFLLPFCYSSKVTKEYPNSTTLLAMVETDLRKMIGRMFK